MRSGTKDQLLDSIIDPAQPWIVRRPGFDFPPYACKISANEWKELLARAKQGHAEAELRVAAFYEDGCRDKRGRILVRASNRKAAQWYRRAA